MLTAGSYGMCRIIQRAEIKVQNIHTLKNPYFKIKTVKNSLLYFKILLWNLVLLFLLSASKLNNTWENWRYPVFSQIEHILCAFLPCCAEIYCTYLLLFLSVCHDNDKWVHFTFSILLRCEVSGVGSSFEVDCYILHKLM
jgi:hypothetical protein